METSMRDRLRRFAADRDWEQFHSPKNLSMALMVEVAELVEHFQWLTQADSENLSSDKHAVVVKELADIQIYLIRLADKLNVDLDEAVRAKIDENEARYPADKVRGSARKYTDYPDSSP